MMGMFSSVFKSEKEDDNIVHLANMPKDERLSDFYDMKNFAHYIGYGGEHLVMAELLLRGTNVSKPAVNDGVDLIVMGNKKLRSKASQF
jgi:hypothetical protein